LTKEYLQVRSDLKKRIAAALVLVAAASWFAALSNRGVNMVDEGVQVGYGWLVADGQVTYRDYFVPVAPLGFVIQAGIIKLFGFHLIAGRFYVVLQGIMAVMIALRLGDRLLDFPFSLVPAILYIPFTAALGSFPHYNLDSAFFLLVQLALLDHYLERPGPGRAAAAALAGSLAFLSKQSVLAAAAPMVLLALYLERNRGWRALGKDAAAALAGFLLPVLVLFVRYAFAHALMEAWQCLTGLGTMKSSLLTGALPRAAAIGGLCLILVRGAIEAGRRKPAAAPFIWASLGGAGLLGLLFLPVQLWGSLVCGVFALSLMLFVPWRGGRPWIMVRAYALLFFSVTALSGLDLGHLLMASAGAAYFAGLVLQNVFQDSRKALQRVALAGFAAVFCTGVYADLAVPHLRHAQGPRWEATTPVALPGLELMLASREKAGELEGAVRWIKRNTRPDDGIFVYPWDLLLYPLAQRRPATYHTFLYYEIFTPEITRRVLDDLEKNKPKAAVVRMKDDRIAHVSFGPAAASMEAYLKAHYMEAERRGNYSLMVRLASGLDAGH